MNLKNQTPNRPLRELVGLTLVPQLGAQRIKMLLQHVEHPQQIFRMRKPELMQVDGFGPALSKTILEFNNWEAVDQHIAKAEQLGAHILTYVDDDYPPLLRQIYDPPILLWMMGDPAVLSTPSLAVVGTRRATRYGLDTTQKITTELARQGLTVISGLALGVDTAAHKSALAAGGKTVAVLGSGIDWIYPSKNKDIAAEMAVKGGAVITEFPPGTKPDAGNFPVRNRIVSGLTLGTLVVESGLKGGSMITARTAADQNREVFVIPHSLTNQNGQGCNAIIKRGWGKLVQNVEDILVELPVVQSDTVKEREVPSKTWEKLKLDPRSQDICQCLQDAPLHIDDLSEQIGLPPHKLLSKLLELEMKECIRQTAGRNFELI